MVPQISLIMGPCAGGGVYSPAMTDFIFMVEGSSQMFITGPDVIASATGETTTTEELGGAMSHAAKSGVAHFSLPGEQTVPGRGPPAALVIPSNNMDDLARRRHRRSRDPHARRHHHGGAGRPRHAVRHAGRAERLLDQGDFMEVGEYFAQNVIVGFGRIGGHSVGLVGNSRCT